MTQRAILVGKELSALGDSFHDIQERILDHFKVKPVEPEPVEPVAAAVVGPSPEPVRVPLRTFDWKGLGNELANLQRRFDIIIHLVAAIEEECS
jgi:hypothetical protein